MTRLSEAKTGNLLVFVSSQGGLGVTRRLTDMGLIPGEKLKVIHSSGHGQITINVKGSKLAVGHGLAQKIVVREA